MRLSARRLRTLIQESIDRFRGYKVEFLRGDSSWEMLSIDLNDVNPRDLEVNQIVYDFFDKYLELVGFDKSDVKIKILHKMDRGSFTATLTPVNSVNLFDKNFIVASHINTRDPVFTVATSSSTSITISMATTAIRVRDFLRTKDLEELPAGAKMFSEAIRLSLIPDY